MSDSEDTHNYIHSFLDLSFFSSCLSLPVLISISKLPVSVIVWHTLKITKTILLSLYLFSPLIFSFITFKHIILQIFLIKWRKKPNHRQYLDIGPGPCYLLCFWTHLQTKARATRSENVQTRTLKGLPNFWKDNFPARDQGPLMWLEDKSIEEKDPTI